jgi:hypothetical protein
LVFGAGWAPATPAVKPKAKVDRRRWRERLRTIGLSLRVTKTRPVRRGAWEHSDQLQQNVSGTATNFSSLGRPTSARTFSASQERSDHHG